MKVSFTVPSNKSVAPGVYKAAVRDIQHKPAKPQGFPGFNWIFKVSEGPSKGGSAFAFTTAAPHAAFLLRSFIEELTGGPIPDDYDFEPRSHLGKKVVITVSASKDPKFSDSVTRLTLDDDDSGPTVTAKMF